MSERKSIKTTISQAVDYWSKRIDECGLSVDWQRLTLIVGVADVRGIWKDAILSRTHWVVKMRLEILFCFVNVVMRTGPM